MRHPWLCARVRNQRSVDRADRACQSSTFALCPDGSIQRKRRTFRGAASTTLVSTVECHKLCISKWPKCPDCGCITYASSFEKRPAFERDRPDCPQGDMSPLPARTRRCSRCEFEGCVGECPGTLRCNLELSRRTPALLLIRDAAAVRRSGRRYRTHRPPCSAHFGQYSAQQPPTQRSGRRYSTYR